MPKTPRKNPTPRKLLRLSVGELEQEENAHVKDVADNFSTAVHELSKPKLGAVKSSNSEFGGCPAAAVLNVESTAQNKSDGRRRSTKHKSTTSLEGRGSSDSTKTSSEFSLSSSKSSKRKQNKLSTRSTKLAMKDAAECFLIDKLSAVDSDDDLHATNINDGCTAKTAKEYCTVGQRIGESIDHHHEVNAPTVNLQEGSCDNVIITDNTCKEDISNRTTESSSSDIMMLRSDATQTVKDIGSAAAGRVPSPDEPESVYMPTPQKNQLRSLSEELFSLNQESAHITTHIHRRSGATPRRDKKQNSGNKRSFSTPRKFNILNSDSRSNSRSPRSTPRKISGGSKTPLKVKFPFSTTPAKSEKEAAKTPGSKKKSPRGSSALKFPTPSKKQAKRKLYAESPEYDARKPAKVSRYVSVIQNLKVYSNYVIVKL